MRSNLRHPYHLDSNFEEASKRINITEDFIDNAVFLTKYPSYFPVGTLRRPANTLSQAIDFTQGNSVIVVYPGDYSGEEPVEIPAYIGSLSIIGVGRSEDIFLPAIIVGTNGSNFSIKLENVTLINQEDEFTVRVLNGADLHLKNVNVLSDYDKAVFLQNEYTLIDSCMIEGRLHSENTSENSLIDISKTRFYAYSQVSDVESVIENKRLQVQNSMFEQKITINSNYAVLNRIKASRQITINSDESDLSQCEFNNSLFVNDGTFLAKDCVILGQMNVNCNELNLKNLEVDGLANVTAINSLKMTEIEFYNDLSISCQDNLINNVYLSGDFNLVSGVDSILKDLAISGSTNINSSNLLIDDLQTANPLTIAANNTKIKNTSIGGDFSINSSYLKINDLKTQGQLSLFSNDSKINDIFVSGSLVFNSPVFKAVDVVVSGDIIANSSSGMLGSALVGGSVTSNQSLLKIESISFKRSGLAQTPCVIQSGGEIYINNAYFESSDLEYMINNNVYVFSIDGMEAKIYFGVHNISGSGSYINKTNGATSENLQFGGIN